MNNEELEQELRTILSNVEFMHGVPVSAPKKTIDELLQFILSREEKLKTRMKEKLYQEGFNAGFEVGVHHTRVHKNIRPELDKALLEE